MVQFITGNVSCHYLFSFNLSASYVLMFNVVEKYQPEVRDEFLKLGYNTKRWVPGSLGFQV